MIDHALALKHAAVIIMLVVMGAFCVYMLATAMNGMNVMNAEKQKCVDECSLENQDNDSEFCFCT
jgi:hypothetical protein